jgi:geranylgeranyl reductase family protein
MELYDVAIVGGGPAGSSCAAFCARAGLRTLLLEREKFPREKVCGDCINPSCWPVLRRLELEDRVRALPHGKLRTVEFIGVNRQSVSIALPEGTEIAVKRSLFDGLLMSRAIELGAEVFQQATVTELSLTNNWSIRAANQHFEARALVAADGRNSTVARLRNLLPRVGKERVALQTHVRLPRDFGERVVLQFVAEGYSGQAPTGNGELNLCLVGEPDSISNLKRWAEKDFGIQRDQAWRTVTPLTRLALPATQEQLFLIGDVARVVEPFTGEGIFYALRSGELAAQSITRIIGGADEKIQRRDYERALRCIYAGRLWLNRLARAAVLSPRFASKILSIAQLQPAVLGMLTSRVVDR